VQKFKVHVQLMEEMLRVSIMTCPPGHIQIRRDTGTNWSNKNSGLGSYLLPGEFGYDTTAQLFKIGPGNWNSLNYLPLGPSGPSGPTGPSGPGFEFNGGLPGTNYALGPTLNCGSVS